MKSFIAQRRVGRWRFDDLRIAQRQGFQLFVAQRRVGLADAPLSDEELDALALGEAEIIETPPADAPLSDEAQRRVGRWRFDDLRIAQRQGFQLFVAQRRVGLMQALLETERVPEADVAPVVEADAVITPAADAELHQADGSSSLSGASAGGVSMISASPSARASSSSSLSGASAGRWAMRRSSKRHRPTRR
jgi:hypothetical protein